MLTSRFLKTSIAVLGTLCAVVLGSVPTEAASQKVAIKQNRAAVMSYWTPARILAAQPKWKSAQRPSQLMTPQRGTGYQENKLGLQRYGSAPKKVPKRGLTRRLAPAKILPKVDPAEFKREAQGQSSGLYTHTQVFPPELAQFYPYSATGKLFGADTITGGGFTCTASMISPRVMITAAHCIFDNANKVFYTNFAFAPGYFNGNAPLGIWTPTGGFITQAWVDITDIVHPEDFAVLILGDQTFESQTFRTGDIAGFYGVAGSDVNTHLFHVDFLGYPGNLDAGEILQRTGAQTLGTFAPNNALYGSDQQGGSSGGPYVIDLQVTPAGGISRSPTVVAVEFFGNGVGDVGVSLLNGNAGAIISMACQAAAGNC